VPWTGLGDINTDVNFNALPNVTKRIIKKIIILGAAKEGIMDMPTMTDNGIWSESGSRFYGSLMETTNVVDKFKATRSRAELNLILSNWICDI
jgi:hypothetical protein